MSIICQSASHAIAAVNHIASEHVHIATANPLEIAHYINNAGAIFAGINAPIALGDYISGTNHILPTANTARFSSGLSVLDFMKRTSVVFVEKRQPLLSLAH